MYAIIDIETGGFSKTKNAICEIAILIVDENREVIKEWSSLIAPYPRRIEVAEEEGQLVSYKEDAMAIHKIPMDEILQAPSAEQIGEEIFELLNEHGISVIVGHNCKSFDKPWVEEFMERFGNGFKFDSAKDTMHIAKSKGLEPFNLPALCKRFEIENESEHRALGDCHATLKLWKALNPINF